MAQGAWIWHYIKNIWISLPSCKKRLGLIISAVMDTVKKYGGKMKSCIAGKDFTELTVSLKLKGNDISAVEEIKKLEGVSSAVLMEYVGD